MLKRLAHCLGLKMRGLFFASCFVVISASSAQAGDEYLVPVSANVPHTIIGNEIVLHAANGTVTFEILLGGWGPELVRTAEAGVDSSGYTSGSGGSLTPVILPNPEAGAFIDIQRPDFIHFGFSSINGVDTSTLDYRYASTMIAPKGIADDQTLRYLGTLKLTASPDAFGTFTIPFDPSVSFLRDISSFEILPLILHEARVTISPRIYVNDDASGANNGSSWANAFQNLQDALAAATVGTEVWVSGGIYKPDQGVGITPGDRAASFLLMNDVALYGGFAGNETTLDQRNSTANPTILSGDLANNDLPDFLNYVENSIHVLNGSGPDATAILDGFTITGGNADGGADASNGGGMFTSSGSPTVRQCRFFRNRSEGNGGGMFMTSSSSQIVACIFIGNTSDSGGGISSGGSGTLLVINCSFHENSTTGAGPNVGGGAVGVHSGGSVALANCIVNGNSSQDTGGGIHVSNDASTATMRNCTVVANIAGNGFGGGGIQVRPSSDAQIENCIVHSNINGQIEGGGTATVNYSLVQGGFVGTQNNDADPVFVDADGADNDLGTEDDDFRLAVGSPCIDAGSRAAVPADATDLDGDGNTSELTPLDLSGNPRFRNEPAAPDTGAGGIPVVDMGAFEFQPAFVDCNNNGVADDLDIFAGTSLDINTDGIPDECQFYDNGCFPVPDWSCPDNWDLGGTYPDNGANTYSVILEGPSANVCLDVTVEVNTLLLDNGASLNMSGMGDCTGNLILAQPGGLAVSNDASLILGPGQSIGEPASPNGAGMTISEGGTVVVDDSTITLTGDVVIESGGSYTPQPPPESNSASLTVGNLLIRNDPDGDAPPGVMILAGTMSLNVLGDLTMDGRYADEPCPNPLARSARTFHTPPSIKIFDAADVNINDSMALLSSVDLSHESAAPITIGGDFVNECITPECVNFAGGAGIVLNGSGGLQFFEAAATDLGATGDVYLAAFAMPSVTVLSEANIEFVDLFDNDLLGQGPCTEAVYVENLVLDSNVTVRINDCRVYYKTANIDPTAVISYTGCGELKSVDCVTAQPAAPEPAPVNKTRFVSFVPGNSGTSSAIRVTLTSLHHPIPYTGGPTISFTAFEGKTLWVGPPAIYIESSATQTPFFGSQLQCEPHYQDWGTIDLLHVSGSAVVPSSVYDVQVVSASCDASMESYFSTSLTIGTTRWGDVETPYTPPAAGQPAFSDITALVAKFRSVPGSPIKARALILGNDSNGNFNTATLSSDLNFSHIAACVDAFRGTPYPFEMGECPVGRCKNNPTDACVVSGDCPGATGPCTFACTTTSDCQTGGPCALYCP